MLDLPTDKPEVVEKGLHRARRLRRRPDARSAGRSTRSAASSSRNGAAASAPDRASATSRFPVLFYNSRYAERLPIGKPEIIRNAPVGAAARVLRHLVSARSHGGGRGRRHGSAEDRADDQDGLRPLKARGAGRRPAARPTVPLHKELLVSVVTDPEVTQSIGARSCASGRARASATSPTTAATWSQRIFEQMLNERFGELARKPDAKFLGAGVGGGSAQPGRVDVHRSARSVQDGKIAGRARRRSRSKRKRVARVRLQRRRAGSRQASGWRRSTSAPTPSATRPRAARSRRNTSTTSSKDEPSPGIDYEYQLVQQLLPGITADGSRRRSARSLLGGRQPRDPRDLAAEGRHQGADRGRAAGARSRRPTRRARHAVDRHDVDARADRAQAGAGRGRRRRARCDDVGVTVVRFANGVEAWLKPTDFKNDQVLFTMNAQGGASLAPPADYPRGVARHRATSSLSGAGGLKALDLQKLLAGKLASARRRSSSLSTHGISGSRRAGAARDRAAAALQRVHRSRATIPRRSRC